MMKPSAVLLLAGVLALVAATAMADPLRGLLPQTSSPAASSPAPARTGAAPARKPLAATLARDEKGGGAGDVFAATDKKIYLLVKDDGGAKGDKIRVVWTAEETGGAFPKNKSMNDFTQTLTGPGQTSSFFTQVAAGFPAGKYRADVYNNGALAKSVKFTVRK